MIPNIRLLGPKVLVALEPKGTDVEDSTRMHYHDKGRTESGIILAQPTDMYDSDDHSRGLVMALGEKKGTVELAAVRSILRSLEGYSISQRIERLDRLEPAPFCVNVGDVVLFSPASGVSLGEQEDGVTYVILLETDLIAIIEPKVEAA